MSIHSLLKHVGIDVPDVIAIDGRKSNGVVEYLNKDGQKIPGGGSFVRYQSDTQETPNVAIVKAVAEDDPWRVQLEILWRHGQVQDKVPPGGWYRFSEPTDDGQIAAGTWHWPPRFQQVPDVFDELPDVTDDPAAQQRRIEELGG